jgi:hypothetical protein
MLKRMLRQCRSGPLKRGWLPLSLRDDPRGHVAIGEKFGQMHASARLSALHTADPRVSFGLIAFSKCREKPHEKPMAMMGVNGIGQRVFVQLAERFASAHQIGAGFDAWRRQRTCSNER